LLFISLLMTGSTLLAYSYSSRSLKSCAVVALSLLSSSTAWSPGRFESRGIFAEKSSTSRLMSSSTSASTCTFTVAQFPCLSDNYGYLIHDPSTGQTAAIDTPDATAYKQELDKRGWKLTHIFNTHQ
jgi:hypothetical protein